MSEIYKQENGYNDFFFKKRHYNHFCILVRRVDEKYRLFQCPRRHLTIHFSRAFKINLLRNKKEACIVTSSQTQASFIINTTIKKGSHKDHPHFKFLFLSVTVFGKIELNRN